MRIALIATFLLLCTYTFTYAQAPKLAWQKLYSGDEGDYGNKVIATADGGSMVVGYTEFGGRDVRGYHGLTFTYDIWVLKLKADGSIDWQRCLGGASVEYGHDVAETADGYLIFGSSGSLECSLPANKGGMDFYLVKLDKSGNLIWEKRYGGGLHEYGSAMTVDATGNIFMVGTSESANGDLTENKGDRDCWIIKVNPAGQIIWQKSFGGTGEESLSSVTGLADGGAIVTGSTLSNSFESKNSHGHFEAVIARLSPTGNLEWVKLMGGSGPDLFSAVTPLKDKSFLIGGQSFSKDFDLSGLSTLQSGTEAWLVNIDATGTLISQKLIVKQFNDIIQGFHLNNDGTVIGVGYSTNVNPASCTYGYFGGVWIFKLSATGNLLWEKTIPSAYDAGLASVDVYNDNSYIVAATANTKDIPGYYGNSSGSNSTVGDVWVMKLYPENFNLPAPVFEIDKNTAIVCPGKTTTIKTKSLNTGTRPIYQWTRNGTIIPGEDKIQLTANDFRDGELISCTVSAGSDCETSSFYITDQVTIKLKTSSIQPEITIKASSEYICGCSEIRFDASVKGAGKKPSYQWKKNGRPVGIDQPFFISKDLAPGDQISCAYSDFEDCINGAESVESNGILMQFSPQSPTPEIQISARPEFPCKGAPVKFITAVKNAGAAPVFDWMKNGQSVGVATDTIILSGLTETDIITCSIKTDATSACTQAGTYISNSLKVKFSEALVPSVKLEAPTDSVCEGTEFSIRAIAKDAGTQPIYQWKINGINTGANTETLVLKNYNNLDTITCTIHADLSNSCILIDSAVSDKKVINIKKPAAIEMSVSEIKNNVCLGGQVIFNAEYTNAGTNPQVTWYVNGNAQLPQGPQFSYQAANGDKIKFHLQPDIGTCAVKDTISQEVTALIKDTIAVSIIPRDTIVSIGKSVQLKTTLSSSPQSYQWTPSEKLLNPASLNPETVPITGDLIFHLSVMNNNGCRSVATSRIRFSTDFYMPNAFTPNGDGLNDIFRIPPRSRSGITGFSIYNRWGQLVFQSSTPDIGWDGTIKGKQAPAGAYIYIISGNSDKGKFSRKATFVLIR